MRNVANNVNVGTLKDFLQKQCIDPNNTHQHTHIGSKDKYKIITGITNRQRCKNFASTSQKTCFKEHRKYFLKLIFHWPCDNLYFIFKVHIVTVFLKNRINHVYSLLTLDCRIDNSKKGFRLWKSIARHSLHNSRVYFEAEINFEFIEK